MFLLYFTSIFSCLLFHCCPPASPHTVPAPLSTCVIACCDPPLTNSSTIHLRHLMPYLSPPIPLPSTCPCCMLHPPLTNLSPSVCFTSCHTSPHPSHYHPPALAACCTHPQPIRPHLFASPHAMPIPDHPAIACLHRHMPCPSSSPLIISYLISLTS